MDRIWMIGALTMIVMKMAMLLAGLQARNCKVNVDNEERNTHCKPPGARRMPPTKSQKNLRNRMPQKEAQIVSTID
jgi:hypothetical protein